MAMEYLPKQIPTSQNLFLLIDLLTKCLSVQFQRVFWFFISVTILLAFDLHIFGLELIVTTFLTLLVKEDTTVQNHFQRQQRLKFLVYEGNKIVRYEDSHSINCEDSKDRTENRRENRILHK